MKNILTKIPLLLLVLVSCNNIKTMDKVDDQNTGINTSITKVITSYSNVPAYIKNYLDSMEQGKYLIADSGQSWSAGCTQSQDKPCRKFISASVSAGTFSMEYWQGGIATQKNSIRLMINGQTVNGPITK